MAKGDGLTKRSSNLEGEQRLSLSGEIDLRRDPSVAGLLQRDVTERRNKPRINLPFPTRAWGVDVQGQAFEVDCQLDNMSSKGLYLRMPWKMKSGDELNLVIKFGNGFDSGATALLRGLIMRDEPQTDGRHGIAVAVKEYHFL